jgi:hypothetical protein
MKANVFDQVVASLPILVVVAPMITLIGWLFS